jgi:hypothetical protein
MPLPKKPEMPKVEPSVYPMWVVDKEGRKRLAKTHENHTEMTGVEHGADGNPVDPKDANKLKKWTIEPEKKAPPSAATAKAAIAALEQLNF